MKPSRINKAHWWTAGAVVLSLVALYGTSPANAADLRPTRVQANRVDRSAMPMSPRGVIERRHIIVERRVAPQAAAGSTVVLRGSRSPAFPNSTAPGPNLNGAGYGSSQAAGPVLLPSAGWDRELDYGGLDYGGSAPLVVTSP